MTKQNTTEQNPEIAANFERLKSLEDDGWGALTSMSGNELRSFEDEVRAMPTTSNDALDNEHQAKHRAFEAVRKERVRRAVAADAARRERQRRAELINKAADLVAEARDAVSIAFGIERPDTASQERLQPLDTETATDGELKDTVAYCSMELRTPSARDRAADARLIEMLSLPSAKAVAKELRAEARERDRRAKFLQSELEAASAELDRREAERERHEREVAEAHESLPETIAALTARIAELEAKRG